MKLFKNLIIIFVLCFIFVINVNAETGYVTDKTGVNMRDKPSTSGSTILLEIPYNAEFYISDINAATGNGCSKSWYYVYYGNNYGYICSNLVRIIGETVTTYGRPWTSPKKAIVGGAEYISKGYIAKGQYTSYLKKFNVNPNGYYPVYNHQYMANLRAPMSEASTTYNSMKDNGLLDNALNFVIPVFTGMPETTYNQNIRNTERQTANVQDDVFETSISVFPEDYKPYLRYLHTIHSNWSFTPLNTGLDFETSYLSEKAVSSIEISSGLCEQDPYYVTESGWCIGNESATKFFLDPRNFLSEKYIFMFENLGYSELYNETVVQSVIENTFMNGISVLDNQSYASIFVEAGRGANVSPLYLASLARQESGTKVTNTTSGAEFTYEGYTYKGLYNFFNIGASSSASNPAKAGLVWANGGKGANGAVHNNTNGNGTNTGNNNPTNISNDFISMLKVNKSGDYLKGYNLGTTIKDIKNKVGSSASVIIKDSNGNIKNDGDMIGTGYTISISNSVGSNTYTYVMYGDVSGDGEINSADLLKIRQYLLGQVNLSGAFKTSAYISGDSEINSADLLKLRQHLLGTSSISQ